MNKAQILAVEDEPIIARDIQNTLKRLGYEVPTTVPSGEEAVQRVEEINPDLVLMDIMLEGNMDGVEAAGLIRDRFDVPVVYLTSHADEGTLGRVKGTGSYGCILKPFEERELRTTIEIVLRKNKTEREFKQQVATILRSIGDGVIATDEDGYVTFMNPVSEGLTGYDKEESLGKDFSEFLKIINEETRNRAENPVMKVMRGGALSAPGNHTKLIAKDGKETPIDYSAAPIRDDNDNISGTVLVFRDITERKVLQQNLVRSEKLAAIGRLAAGVAHEINNPLATIKTSFQIMSNKLESEVLRDEIKVLTEEVDRIARIVGGLLDFSHPTQTESAQVSLAGVLESDLFTIIKKQLLNKGIQLKVEVSAQLPPIMAPEDRLKQVFMNLIRNAEDAMPEGGGLTIRAKSHREGLEIEFSDTGSGIPQDEIANVFDPFFSTKGLKGTGLGLSITHGIVRSLGGTIGVSSAVEGGSTFRIILPISNKS